VFTRLASDFPQIPRYGEEQAAARDILGEVLSDLGRNREAKLSLEPAVESYERLARAYPDVPEYRQRLAVARSHLAQVLHKLGETKAAEDIFRSSYTVLEDLCRTDAKTVSYRDDLAFVCASFGSLLQETNRLDEAETMLRKARQTWKELVGQHRSPEHQYNLAWFLANGPMAQLRDPQGAIELAKQAKDKVPANPNYARALGAAYYRAGQWQPGIQAIQEAIRLRGQSNACDGFLLAMLQQRLGQKDEAAKSYEKARKAMEANTKGNLDVVRMRREAAQLLKLAD
jgi:tetratricopeptide (TPR) repeat protein